MNHSNNLLTLWNADNVTLITSLCTKACPERPPGQPPFQKMEQDPREAAKVADHHPAPKAPKEDLQ